ncbi:hypothetical protein Tco_0061378 [Tanacetum coccineum]
MFNPYHGSINAITIHPKQPEGSQVNRPDEGQEEEGNLGNTSSNPYPQPDPLASIATEQMMMNLKIRVPMKVNEMMINLINGTNEVAYKMPHKIEQYNSLSDLEKEHTKSVYLRNEEDKRRGVEYVMSKILGFYKECLELGPEYLTGMDDEGEVT